MHSEVTCGADDWESVSLWAHKHPMKRETTLFEPKNYFLHHSPATHTVIVSWSCSHSLFTASLWTNWPEVLMSFSWDQQSSNSCPRVISWLPANRKAHRKQPFAHIHTNGVFNKISMQMCFCNLGKKPGMKSHSSTGRTPKTARRKVTTEAQTHHLLSIQLRCALEQKSSKLEVINVRKQAQSVINLLLRSFVPRFSACYYNSADTRQCWREALD